MAGQLVQVATNTVSSATAEVSLQGITTDDVYMVTLLGVTPDTDTANLSCYVGISGTRQTTSNYDGAFKRLKTNTTFSNDSFTNAPTGWFVGHSLGTATSENANSIIYCYNFNNSSEYSFLTFEDNILNSSAVCEGRQGGGVYTVAESHNSINFRFETGNIASGTFTLYKVL
tara:strand:+ start:155 stop:670 length:516 start_codon:yes stop_codon:yes gene_type:complete